MFYRKSIQWLNLSKPYSHCTKDYNGKSYKSTEYRKTNIGKQFMWNTIITEILMICVSYFVLFKKLKFCCSFIKILQWLKISKPHSLHTKEYYGYLKRI